MKKIKFGETTKLLLTEEETLFSQGDEGDKAYMIISGKLAVFCLLYTSPSPRDRQKSRMPSSA